MNTRRRKSTFIALAALLLALGLGQVRPGSISAQISPAIDENVVARVVPAVVEIGPIAQVTDVRGATKFIYIGWGSGTLISPDGFILTNHQVADIASFEASLGNRPDVKVLQGKLAVFLSTDTDTPPLPTYIAEVAADSTQYNLAVLRITADLDGKAVDSESLNLPYITLGDSSKLKLGQKINIFGYPAAEGEAITLDTGDITGFTSEAGVQGRAWIKTNATLSGGNRGGAAVDDSGLLVGVPAEAGGPQGECSPVRDTNGDGKLDDKDICVPLGGTIKALRPIDLAKAIVIQAMNGVGPNPKPSPTKEPRPSTTPTAGRTTTPDRTTTPTVEGTTTPGITITPTVGGTTTPGTAGPRITPTTTPEQPLNGEVTRSFFANGVSDSGYDPISIVKTLPTGSNSLVLFFDYKGFEDGVDFQPRIFINGQEEEDAFPVKPWDASEFGTYGSYWFGFLDTEEPLPDGVYDFQVDYGGRTLVKKSLEIGGSASDAPICGEVALSGGGENGTLLPSGIDSMTATCKGTNMSSIDTIQAKWSAQSTEGDWEELGGDTIAWNGKESGDVENTLSLPNKLEQGLYRVEFLISDGKDLLATSDVYLSDELNNNGGDERFGPITFSDEVDESGMNTNPGTSFPSGTYKLYASWEYKGMQEGTPYGVIWTIDDEVIFQQDYKWDVQPDGVITNYYLYNQDGKPLADGKYGLALTIQGKEVQKASATIGDVNNRPTPTPTTKPGDQVHVSGTIKDAVTGKPVKDALFVVLKEGITWSDFQDNEDQVLDKATTDRQGKFVLNTPLERGHTYSMGVFAQNYQPILVDGAEVDDTVPEDAVLDIVLDPK